METKRVLFPSDRTMCVCSATARLWFRMPLAPRHVYVPVGLEAYSLALEHLPLLRPPGDGAPEAVDNPVARIDRRRAREHVTYKAGVSWRVYDVGYLPVAHHLAARYLRHDAVYRVAEVRRRAYVGIAEHLPTCTTGAECPLSRRGSAAGGRMPRARP